MAPGTEAKPSPEASRVCGGIASVIITLFATFKTHAWSFWWLTLITAAASMN